MVFRSTKGKNEEEEVRKKDETNFETSAFLERIAEFDGGVDFEEDGVGNVEDDHNGSESAELASIGDIASGDGEQDGEDNRDGKSVNPEVNADNPTEDVDVVNWDDGFPARFASFRENFPPGDDEQDIENQGEDEGASKHTTEEATSSNGFVLG